MVCETVTRLDRASFCLSVRPSVRQQLAKRLITLVPHGIFNKNAHAYTCLHCLTTSMHNIFDGRGFAEQQL